MSLGGRILLLQSQSRHTKEQLGTSVKERLSALPACIYEQQQVTQREFHTLLHPSQGDPV